MKAQLTPRRQAAGSDRARKDDAVDRICRSTQTYYVTLVTLAAISAGGCGPKSAKLSTYMQPELLYVKEQPYTRLYIEVDVMEGVEVPQEWLDELKAFLTEHCVKPDGATLVRDEPVPAAILTNAPMEYVAILCTDGPPRDQGDQPAYLHVVFYDSRKWPKQEARNPGVVSTCPTAILCDVSYAFGKYKNRIAGAILRHEAGHVLGLCQNLRHGDGAHCRHHGCLMEWMPTFESHVGLWVGVPYKGRLCKACRDDLTSFRNRASPENLSFAGPFLVRHEDSYDVVSLPFGDILFLEPGDRDYSWQAILAKAKEKIAAFANSQSRLASNRRKSSRSIWVFRDVWYPTDRGPGTDAYRTALTKATQDPSPTVRYCARTFLAESSEQDAAVDKDP